jgi:hypothetical protein
VSVDMVAEGTRKLCVFSSAFQVLCQVDSFDLIFSSLSFSYHN